MNIGIITIAGKGERLKEKLKMEKQFFPFKDGKEMFLSSLDAFLKAGFTSLFLVIAAGDKSKVDSILKREGLEGKVHLVLGGQSREESVRNALEAIYKQSSNKKEDTVFIHDGDRPFLTVELINRLKENLRDFSGVIPYTEQTNSLFNLKDKNYVKREEFASIQTPQVFNLEDIHQSFNKIKGREKEFSDEGQIALASNYKVNFIKGDSTNIKISDENSLMVGLYYLKKGLSHE